MRGEITMATKKLWKKIIAVALAVLLAFSSVPVSYTVDTYAATATKLYLKPNSNWLTDGARFAAYFFNNGETWVSMTDTDGDGYYECDVPSGYPSVIFCRMDPATTANNWTNKWNQSSDLSVPTDGTNCYTLASSAWDNGSGSWSTKIFGYYVAGSSGLCGESWDTLADPMTANSDGTYSITFSNVAAGTHTFKVVANGDYSAGSWPSSDYSLNVTTASDVTITFTPSTSNISVTQTPLTCSHSYTSQVTTAATCTTDGVRTYTCSKCGDTYTEVIAASGHTMVNGTCSVCGYSTITTYTVTFSGSGVSSNGASTASSGSNYTATLTANSGYTLPTSITVKRGSTTLTSGTHYTYNSSTGALTINSSAITGNITITATGVAASEPDTGSGSYVLVDSLADITAGGEFVIVVNDNGTYYALGTTVSSSKIAGTTVTVSGDTVTSSNPPIWTITNVSGSTVTFDANDSYLRYTGSSTNLAMSTTSTTNRNWTIAAGTNGYTVTNATYTSRKLGFSISNTQFGAYSSTTSTYSYDLLFYKYQEAGSGDTAEDYYTVVGTQSLTGSNWDTTDTDNLMTQNADGTYSITYNNVAAGNYEVKAVKNGSYDEGQWPYSGNKAFTVSKTSNVTVTLNLTTNELTVTVEPVVNSYNVTFNGTNVTSNGASTANDAENYTATLTAGSGYTLPDTITVKRGSTTLTSGTHYTYNSSTGALTINSSAITGDITITATGVAEPVEPESTGMYILVTDISQILAGGEFVIVANYNGTNYALGTSVSSNYITGTSVTVDNKVVTSANPPVWTIDPVSGNTVTISANGSYLRARGSSYTYLQMNTTSQSWTVAQGTSGFTFTNASYTTRALIFANSYTRFGAYSTSSSTSTYTTNLKLYKYQDYYTVVGTQSLTGSNWDTTDTNNLMTQNADGTYSITYNNVAAGDYEVKAVKNGSYDIGQWPYSGNKAFTVSKTSTVTVTLNLTTNELTVTVEPVVNSYNVTFNGTNVTSNGASTANDAENYTATLTPATGYHLPADITVKRGSTTLTSGTHYTYNSSTGALTINASAISGDIAITAAAEQDYYIVVGTQSLTGSNWDTTDTDNLMTQNADGTYSITYNNVAAGNYEIKAIKNGSYDAGQWPYSGNKSFTVDETSKVTVNLNLTTNELTVDVVSLVSHYEVTFNGTNVTSNGSTAADDEHDYTATLTAAAGYKLPSAITVKVGGSTLSSSYYTYNSSTGALSIPASRITGDITITAVAEDAVYMVVGTQSLTGSDWDTTDTDNLMTKNADGTYTIVYSAVPAGTHEFKITENGEWKWPADNYVLNLDSTSKVTITYNPATGEGNVTVESVYVRTDEIDLPADKVYYATVDLVDYLNNSRVENDQVKGYFTDNQGEWLKEDDAVFSYMNNLVSQQVANGNQYTYPLYFGPLHYVKSRYSKVVGSDAWLNLGNWSTAANVAFGIKNEDEDINSSGVAQGLVKNTLDANGNLVDPSTNATLLYFNQEAAETWTNNGHKVMAYYPNLQFPFVMSYDEDTRVTTYSYDSAKDYAVYYDYTNPQLYASNTHVKDYKGNSGFYPLNAPTDADNQVNNGFGAKFTIDFTVGEDGYLANGEPVTFEFTGDDDVWVFIDGVLVLDMGGAHAMANGKIDFAAKKATVSNAASVFDSYKITSGTTYQQATYSGQNLENYIYDGYNDGIDVMERATLETSDVSATFESLGLDFDYGSVHTMTVFYMERGMFESNFSMEFTMVPVPSGLTLSKNLNDTEINKGLLDAISRVDDLSFTLAATSPSSTSVAFSQYTLLDKYTGYSALTSVSGTTSGRTYTATINGINSYVYAHSFVTANGEDAFIPGTSFTITETTKGIFTYTGTTWAIYDANNGYQNITSSVKTSTANTSSKTARFTMGTAGSTTAYSYAVSFTNTMALGNLQVVKNVSDASLNGVDFTFKVYIDLDGSGSNFTSSLYPGLVYTVDGTTYTSADGTIIVPGGKMAVISGLPAGATFVVEEVVPSGVNWILSSSSGTTGTIEANNTQIATFTNAMEVGTLQIFKVFNSSWLSDTQFTFTVYVDADGSGSAYSSSLYTGSYTIGGTTYTTSNGTITLSGGQTAVISGLPAGATYTVSETVPTNAAWELSSSTGTTGTITANGTKTASFTNTLKTGNLQISKVFNDSVLGDTRFTFTVYVDADGSGSAYSSSLYTGSYTIGGTTYTTNNGTITLSGGQTAVISGLPAGATYQVAEVIPSDAPWQQVSKSGDSGSIIANGTASARFTNAVNTLVENKTIYVEAGTPTDYTLSYDGQIVDITDLTPVTGLTATDNDDHIQVTGQDPDKQYTLTYEGRLEDGTIIGGSITVYTFRAMDKVYVFDFGLSSNLADTTYGYGLFQQDYLFNQYASGESAALYAITGNENNTQTAITYTQDAAIQADGKSSEVTFRPTAFMSKVETYSYTVRITAFGETFEAGNPETGCAVTGTIEVMPANSVYYEDNFNIGGSDASEKFIYSNSKKAPTTAPTVSQSNDQSSNYGYDDAYLGDYADSNDSATVLDHEEYTYFTFTGTGFDLDSRTTASTAGMAVYVFQGTHEQEYLDYVTDLEYKGTLPSQPVDMVFVNNYYANGNLYQVPVVSVRLDECATYTVYIQCLSTYYASSVIIDGVRIYNPLKDTSKYLLDNEKNTSREELRVMYKDGLVSHAIKNGTTVANGLGKGSIVEQITGGKYTTAQELMDIYKTGPNNEMYLPANCGIGFSYTVTDADWTLQLGAKAVTASNDPKTISVWVRSGYNRYTMVDTIELKTTTDMYYDLTGVLADYCEIGTSYDIIIISEEAEDINNEFVSLTTVKYAGVTLG